ncbi:MAG: hypothetical protein K8R91_05160, partial [Phycisphaerae bacterium]|nr:hypothetical protein [Phycisphaerae bacterium]
GWDQPGTTRPGNYGISEMDNIDFNLPNAALVVDADIDLRDMLSVTGQRLVQNAPVTADTIKMVTQRGLQTNYLLNATNNGDIVLRVTGQSLADYANALSQATGQAAVGELTGVTVSDGGAYYDFAPIVSVLGSSGYGARALAVVDANGQVVAIDVTAVGDGYFTTPAPIIRIAPPASIQINAPLTSSTVDSDPGTGDGRGTFTLRADLGSIDMGGYIDFPTGSFVEWEDGGFQYRSSSFLDDITPDSFPQTIGGSGATAEAVLDGDGRVTAINILTGGSGYSSDFLPAVEIQGIAEATAIIEGGQVVGFQINNPGSGYAIAPEVTIRPNGFGKIVGSDADQTALNRTHLKSSNGYLVAVAYYGVGQGDQPIRTDVRNMVAQTFDEDAGVNVLEKDSLAIGLIDQVNGISTIDGDVSAALFGGTLSLGVPVQQTNASGQLLWQDATWLTITATLSMRVDD